MKPLESRLLFIVGASLGLVGSAILAMWGPSFARVFSVFLVLAPARPVVADSGLSEFALAGLGGACFGLGAALAAWGFVAAVRDQALSLHGVLMMVIAGALSALAGTLAMSGSSAATQALQSLAKLPRQPNPEDIASAVAAGAGKMSAGYAVLLVSQVVLLVTGLTGFVQRRTSVRKLGAQYAIAIVASLCGVLIALFSALAGFGDSQLQAIFASTPIQPKPSMISAVVSTILHRAHSANTALIVLGVLEALAPIATLISRDQRPPDGV